MSSFIPLTEDGIRTAVTLDGEQSTTAVGGSIPTRFTPPYGISEITLNGTVVVEFVKEYVDPNDPTKYKYKYLYGVPVEVKFA